MTTNTFMEIGIGTLFVMLVGLLIFSNTVWMPSMATMLTLVLIVALFAAFTVFIWREREGDEREQLLRFVANRWAFLAVGVVLLVGIVYETIVHHAPNPWLGAALVIMVIAKIIGHAYARTYH